MISQRKSKTQADSSKPVRCAVYTRKSTEHGLDQEYSTLDAQRDNGEAFILSRETLGWSCLPDRYDDGGFSGGTMDRPALNRLIADIKAGLIDCIAFSPASLVCPYTPLGLLRSVSTYGL